ncbi:AbrB/MazE/SpoVT family DNA-binding domain-containing protein [Sphingomonas montanisoli]|uniref:AbrB/MazE/SpoVT family DNA-binding domain-containing protein n=1 Tax=Sphingomonas montanisoli TaxID=2606412 RepID=A0A5D9CG97_9SPHN|nr:AbrB/MazE/SpoVT family DNA-binding domain-containing protein [Sphingomonas montanisoli]TZG29085.1 AbrB/MazE/SpoVT family DNA-binding domain-containing protein [Sphingomonas montanisoli]
MSKQSNLTIKGQVTIPKDVRDALGLRPGEPVEFDWNAAGEAVIRKGRERSAAERRVAEGLAALEAIRGRHRTGRPIEDIMRDLRGDDPLP